MLRECVIPLIVVLATVSAQERGPVQWPGAQTPVFSSRAERLADADDSLQTSTAEGDGKR
jgi:hypothetical protein